MINSRGKTKNKVRIVCVYTKITLLQISDTLFQIFHNQKEQGRHDYAHEKHHRKQYAYYE